MIKCSNSDWIRTCIWICDKCIKRYPLFTVEQVYSNPVNMYYEFLCPYCKAKNYIAHHIVAATSPGQHIGQSILQLAAKFSNNIEVLLVDLP